MTNFLLRSSWLLFFLLLFWFAQQNPDPIEEVYEAYAAQNYSQPQVALDWMKRSNSPDALYHQHLLEVLIADKKAEQEGSLTPSPSSQPEVPSQEEEEPSVYRSILHDLQQRYPLSHQRSKALYNEGIRLAKAKENDKAVEAFKETLRLDPDDDDARYNLEILLKNQQGNSGDQDNQEQEENQDQDQDQNQDQNNDDSSDQDQQNQDQQNQEQEQQQQDQEEQKEEQEDKSLSEEEKRRRQAEALLRYFEQQEKQKLQPIKVRPLSPRRGTETW